ncbi:hypothetical protein MNV49_004788 [Pseudohyphozyma bogoriensis]|nr:hypothetical protein MNV49_004788 [Pseudohyphozyma bogoriensis]
MSGLGGSRMMSTAAAQLRALGPGRSVAAGVSATLSDHFVSYLAQSVSTGTYMTPGVQLEELATPSLPGNPSPLLVAFSWSFALALKYLRSNPALLPTSEHITSVLSRLQSSSVSDDKHIFAEYTSYCLHLRIPPFPLSDLSISLYLIAKLPIPCPAQQRLHVIAPTWNFQRLRDLKDVALVAACLYRVDGFLKGVEGHPTVGLLVAPACNSLDEMISKFDDVVKHVRHNPPHEAGFFESLHGDPFPIHVGRVLPYLLHLIPSVRPSLTAIQDPSIEYPIITYVDPNILDQVLSCLCMAHEHCRWFYPEGGFKPLEEGMAESTPRRIFEEMKERSIMRIGEVAEAVQAKLEEEADLVLS